MRIALVFLVAFACVRLSPITVEPPRPRDRVLQASSAVTVDVLCVPGNGDEWMTGVPFGIDLKTGSGVAVSARHVLTALHVVDCPYLPTVRVTFENGKSYRVVVERECRDLDLARLVLMSAEHWPVSRPAIAQASPGEAVCTATTRPARGWNCGTVEMVATKGEGNVVYTARTEKGNSGSGVYDLAGQLVGIVVEMSSKGSDYGGRATSIVDRGLMP